PHAERYARAAEFVEAVRGLWRTWPATSIRADRTGAYVDVERVRPVDHAGPQFRVAGPLNVPSPPQGEPVLFQAGASTQGRALAARYAVGLYAVAYDMLEATECRCE